MDWLLQTPGADAPKVLGIIAGHSETATAGGAAFAFASAQGIRLLTAEPLFKAFLERADFTLVVGLDTITDTQAVEALAKVSEAYPKFRARLFLHSLGGALFHPKTIWFRTPDGGVVITGSGNLTSGGMSSNWEAFAVTTLSAAELMSVETRWNAWCAAHQAHLVTLDDPKAVEKAKANGAMRARIRQAVVKPAANPDGEDAQIEAAHAELDEIERAGRLNPVLIAEVPRSGNRWQQVNFDLKSYQDYFGVTKAAVRHVRFYEVKPDGSLGVPEDRQSVSVVSQNYRFEVGAAHAVPYPDEGHPIIVFVKTAESTFHYVLLMPGSPAHATIQTYLNENFARTNKKLRVQMTADVLEAVWPDSPLFK
jgi:hypothetical protein